MSTAANRLVAPTVDARRMRTLSGVAEVTIDVRKACNGIKRMAALGAASMVLGVDTKRAVAAAETMAIEVLSSIGFDVENAERLESVLPMMMEATALVVADAAYHAGPGTLSVDALAAASKFGVETLGEVARSRAVAKMVEPSYPPDMGTIVAIRLTAATAMAVVAVEIANFDFVHPAKECIREAGKVVVKTATAAALEIAPTQVSPGTRLMLTQSLIQAGARVYAAAWRTAAQDETYRLDSLADGPREDSLAAMQNAPLSQLLEAVNSRFSAMFAAITSSSIDLSPRAAAEQAASPAHRRPSMR